MKIARKFEDLTNAVDFIRKKFADYEVEKGRRLKLLSHYEVKFQLSITILKIEGFKLSITLR